MYTHIIIMIVGLIPPKKKFKVSWLKYVVENINFINRQNEKP